jgi:hypothetical protein
LNPFLGNLELQEIPTENLTSILFPNKLKNLNHHKLKLPVTFQVPKIFAVDMFGVKKVFAKYTRLADILKDFMNAEIHYEVISVLNFFTQEEMLSSRSKTYEAMRQNLEVDLSISDVFVYRDKSPKLLTYEPVELCAFLAVPPEISLYTQILILPFEKTIWILLVISVMSCAIIWRAYEKIGIFDQCGKFIFGIFGFFLGQGTNFGR